MPKHAKLLKNLDGGIIASMIELVLSEPQQWQEEGAQEERERSEARRRERQRIIAAIAADPELSDAAKVRAIAAINNAPEDDA